MKHLHSFINTLCLLLALLLCQACHFPWSEKHNKRTVIIYMDANNNLSQWAHTNLNDILTHASRDNMKYGRMLVFINNQNGKNLYEIQPFSPQKNDYRGDTTLVCQYHFASALETASMRQVLSDAMQEAPADEYALILWSHSTGWLPADIEIKESAYIRSAGEAEMPITKTFGMDGNKQITYSDIAKAVDGLGLDIIMIDACFGTCIEALYDWRDACDYVVASPIEILGAGYPYADLMQHLFDQDVDIEGLGRRVCASYMDYYRQYEFHGIAYPYGAISLIDMSKIEALAQATQSVMQVCQDVRVEHEQVQALENRNYSIYYDFYHYIRLLTQAESPDIFSTFASAFDACVVYHDHTEKLYSNLNGYSTRALKESHGISTYIPRPDHSSYFSRCDEAYFETDWAKFIY